MANREHLAKLKEGVGVWNDWRRANPKIAPDLSEAELVEENLSEADLRGTNFRRTVISVADLTEANLGAASLHSANLSWAVLNRANLAGASIGYATFGDNDLSDVKGLDAVRHDAPSTIGIDTIYRSHGNIP